MKDRIEKFIEISKSPITTEIGLEFRVLPQEFSTIHENTDAEFARLVFAGIENGKPIAFFVRINFRIIKGKIVVQPAIPASNSLEDVFAIGVSDEAIKYIHAHPAKTDADVDGVLKSALYAEADQYPRAVGGFV